MENNQNQKHPDKNSPEKNIDSPINMRDAQGDNLELESLTNDESASTDPNEVNDKAAFGDHNPTSENKTGRFDGTIDI